MKEELLGSLKMCSPGRALGHCGVHNSDPHMPADFFPDLQRCNLTANLKEDYLSGTNPKIFYHSLPLSLSISVSLYIYLYLSVSILDSVLFHEALK